MRKYVLTSSMFAGSVTFGFNENGWLVYYVNEAEFTDQQFAWLYNINLEKGVMRLPLHINAVESLATIIKGKLTEVPPDLSFDAFWDAYAKKVNRKRAETYYKKMSDAQRLKCVMSVKPYLNYLARVKWRSQADPDTYLRQEMYETEWNRLLS